MQHPTQADIPLPRKPGNGFLALTQIVIPTSQDLAAAFLLDVFSHVGAFVYGRLCCDAHSFAPMAAVTKNSQRMDGMDERNCGMNGVIGVMIPHSFPLKVLGLFDSKEDVHICQRSRHAHS